MNAMEFTGITKTFKGKGNAVVEAVKGLTLSVQAGEIFGFLGPNGAGKSTTIKMLLGLLRPTSGTAAIQGIDSTSHLSRSKVGYLPENPSFYDYLTASEYLVFVGKTFNMPGELLKERVESNLKLLELWDARNRQIRGYSKGMVQRLGLAQALIHDPDVYVLDEPMSGLDPVGRALVKEIILDLKKRGKCVFFSTHIIADVETVCDRVGIIVQGTLQCVEQVNAILTEGIVGYQIKFRIADTAELQSIEIPRQDLVGFIADTHARGREITLIEPRRKNLETFFLDIVKGKQC